ncbi:hypothetical protein D3C72_2177790 [compost metagenome]
MDLGRFQQFTIGLHALEGGHVDEIVVLAVDLIGAAGAGGDRHGQLDVGIGAEQGAGDGRFAGARGRSDDQHDAAALKFHQPDPIRCSALARVVDRSPP